MISACIFAAVLVVASSEVVQYHKDIECSVKGPEFWCRNEDTAKQCLATNYCSEHVWAKKEPMADYCTTCKQYVGTVHMLLANNNTQAEILTAMKNMCTMLPASIQSTCTDYVTQYGQEAMAMLVQYTADPKQFCTLIGLCSTAENINEPAHTRILKNLMIQQGSTDYCLTCEQYVGTIHLFISNKASQEQLINGLKSACSLLPASVSSECTALMTLYAPQIVQWLVDYTAKPSQFCTMIGLCQGRMGAKLLVRSQPARDVLKISMEPSQPVRDVLKISMEPRFIKKTAPALKLKSVSLSSGVTCELCTVAMSYLEGILKEKSTKATVKNALDQLCTYLPAELNDECKLLVNQYSDQIITLLVDELKDTTEICKELGLCSNAKKGLLSKKTVDANPITCEVCEYAAGYLANMLQGNATEAAVKQALGELCNELPASMAAECTSLVNTYTDAIIKLIVTELKDPATLCKELGLCPTSWLAVKKTMPNNPIECELCEVAMGYLENMLKGNTTEAAITHALENLCGLLPSSYQSECDSLVKQYANKIIQLLVNELANPATLCKELGLCSTSSKGLLSKKALANPITCEVCEYAAGYLAKMLQGNATEAAVKQALGELCNELPASMAAECTSLVNTYTDAIIKLIVTELKDPATLCKELGLCPTSWLAVKKTMPNNPIECELCEVAMGYLENMLKGNTTEAAITHALENLCGLLPSSYQSECDSLVKQYANQIIQLLVNELADPATLCKELDLCTSSLKTVKATSLKTVKAKAVGAVRFVGCEICTWVMGKLDAMLKEKPTQDEIKQALKSLCNDLPSTASGECTALVNTYSGLIISMLAEEMDPTTICAALKLCTAEKTILGNRKYALALRYALKGVSCQVCQYAMGYLDEQLLSKAGEAEVEAAVEKLCSYLPAAIENECDALITEYGDDLIKLVVQQIQPVAVCTKLKLC